MKKVGCFLILLMLIGLYILGSFFSEEDNTSPQKMPSDTPIVDSTAKKVQQPAEKTDTVVDTLITTPQNINRDAKEMDWFATPEAQNLKVGDFIIVTGQPNGYIGAAAEPFGDELFPTFKLVYGKPCNLFFIEHWIYPAQGEICNVMITSDIDFGKIQSVREYNSARQGNMDNDDWLKHHTLTIIVQIKSIEYSLYNEEIGNLWSIDAIYVPGDMLHY